jgi:hypothetical protein
LSLAYPVSNLADPGELFEAVAIEVDEGALDTAQPGDVAFGDVPADVVTRGLKCFDKVVRERLDDAVAVDVWYDPATKTWGGIDDSPEALALRIGTLPGELTKRSRLEGRLAKKRADHSLKSKEISGRRMEKWASIGTSVLSNLGLVFGRKRTVTGVGGVLSKSRMEQTARDRKSNLEREIEELEAQLSTAGEVDPARFERRTLKPARADVSELRRELVWVY